MARSVLSLAITSSTSVVGVAIGRPGADIVFEEVTTDRRHAEELTPLLERTLRNAGVALGDIERFVVDVGPGRFTGLRVGLATARTLALAVDRPVVGLTSLEVLAAAEDERPVVAVIDARRSEVFQQRFDVDGPTGPAAVGDPAVLADQSAGAIIVGDGADRYHELYGSGVVLGRVPSAAVMISLSAGREARPGPEVTPQYLRDPDVNVNVKTRHSPR